MNEYLCLINDKYMRYPYIRKQHPNDYDAIWRIWMQDHIIQWMSFTK